MREWLCLLLYLPWLHVNSECKFIISFVELRNWRKIRRSIQWIKLCKLSWVKSLTDILYLIFSVVVILTSKIKDPHWEFSSLVYKTQPINYVNLLQFCAQYYSHYTIVNSIDFESNHLSINRFALVGWFRASLGAFFFCFLFTFINIAQKKSDG